MKWRTKQAGFTLVELMVVVLILGILISLGVVKLSSARDRARQASTKTNMHAFRTLIEIYAINYGGLYPSSVQVIIDDKNTANEKVLHTMRNPYGAGAGVGKSYADEFLVAKLPGMLTMQFDGLAVGYTIYGYDQNIKRIKHRGDIYALSNH